MSGDKKGDIPPKKTFATLPKTERGRPVVIGGDPKGKNFLYCCGNSVIIRDIADPSVADIYTEHSKEVNVAKYSPSGFYIASGDAGGKVRIWDTTQKEHILKAEYQPLGGAIKDLQWSPDSQKIVVVGEGREKYGHVFSMDTGTSVGSISTHSKPINSVAYRQARPFRIVTASEDQTAAFFEGPPFKFKFTISDHTNFVNAVRYSPSGDVFITGGADGKAYVYDGKEGQKIGELGSPAHKGGIYALSFNNDGKKVLTVSGDKTAKIWDVESRTLEQEFVMGDSKEDMQEGCLWQGDYILTMSLSGHINYLDVNNPAKPYRIIKGHNKPITSMAITEDKCEILAGGMESLLYNADTGETEQFCGKGHKSQLTDMTIVGDNLISIGVDDTFKISQVSRKEFGADSTNLPSQPRCVRALPDLTSVVACINHIVVLQGGDIVFTQQVKWEPCSVAVHPGGTLVAIGGKEDKKIHLFDLKQGSLTEIKQGTEPKLKGGEAMAMAFSPDGAYLATGAADRHVLLHSLPDFEEVYAVNYHTAKVLCVAWAPDSQRFATGSLDQSVIVWNLDKKNSKEMQIKCHKMSQVNGLSWLNNNQLATVGQDSNVKIWDIPETCSKKH